MFLGLGLKAQREFREEVRSIQNELLALQDAEEDLVVFIVLVESGSQSCFG